MAKRQADIPGLGEVTIYKRRGSRHVRLSVSHEGNVRVTIPFWAPYKIGKDFAKEKADWIRSRLTKRESLTHNTRVGKAHSLLFIETSQSRISSRIIGNEIRVFVPIEYQYNHSDVQRIARSACIKALKLQADTLLPGRIDSLARSHGFNYNSLKVKQLKSRWGSCSSKGEIVLSCFLMQLPWHLIDYVIMHELLHTRRMAHGSAFWSELSEYVDDLPSVRRQMRNYKPLINGQKAL